MTLFDVEELSQYWADNPPVHILVAAYLGVKPKETASAPGIRAVAPPGGHEDVVATALAALGPMSGFVERDVHEGLPPPILDFDELSATALRKATKNSGGTL